MNKQEYSNENERADFYERRFRMEALKILLIERVVSTDIDDERKLMMINRILGNDANVNR